MRKNITIKKLAAVVLIIMSIVMISGLHVRVVTASYDNCHDTIELHSGKISEEKECFYPYGDDHPVNLWFAW